MEKKITGLSIVSLIMAACLSNCGSNNSGSDFPTLDIEAAIDNERTFDLSEITDGIEFIALDGGSEGSLVGNISRMQESRDRFYISDGNRNPVKVFDKTGKFLSTRGLIGRGPNELPNIGDFAIDYLQDNVYLRGGNSTIAAYDSEGHLISRNDSILQSAAIACVDDKLLVLKNRSGETPVPGGKTTLIEMFSSDLQREGGVDVADKGWAEEVRIPFPEGGMMVLFITGSMSYNGNTTLVKESFSDTVFHYRSGGVPEPAYRLDPGRYTVPAGVAGDNPPVQWSDMFRPLRNIWEGDRYILASTINYGWDITIITLLVLDKRDPAGGFSPLGPDGKPGLFLGGIRFAPMYIRDNRLVGYMQAIDIVDNAASITNPDLKALAATLKEDSNPVIVIAKLRK